MKPNVLYYKIIAHLTVPCVLKVYRPAIISSATRLNAENFPLELAVNRFLLLYNGPSFETKFWPTAPSRTARTFALEWLEKKAKRLSGRRMVPGVLDIHINLGTIGIFPGYPE